MDWICRFPALGNRCVTERIWVRRYRARSVRVSNLVRSGITGGCSESRVPGYAGGITAHIQVKRLTGPHLEDVVGLPVAQEPRRWTGLQPALSVAERKFVNRVPGQA